MNVKKLSISDVRDICRALIDKGGNSVVVSTELGVPVKLIEDIKTGKYMKFVSDEFPEIAKFRTPAKGVKEPEVIKMELSEELVKTEVPAAVTNVKRIPRTGTPEEKIRKICEKICEGTVGAVIAKAVGISPNVVSLIKLKKRYVNISDEYFKYVDSTSFKVLKTGKIISLDPKAVSQMKSPVGSDKKKVPFSHKSISVTEAPLDELFVPKQRPTVSEAFDKMVDEIFDTIINTPISKLPSDLKSELSDIVRDNLMQMTLAEIKELTCNGK